MLHKQRAELENDLRLAVIACGGEEETAIAKIKEARNLPQTHKHLSAIREAHLAVMKMEADIRAENRKQSEAERLEAICKVSDIAAVFVFLLRYGIVVRYDTVCHDRYTHLCVYTNIFMYL